jgi:hypothetical protein
MPPDACCDRAVEPIRDLSRGSHAREFSLDHFGGERIGNNHVIELQSVHFDICCFDTTLIDGRFRVG